MANGDGVAGTAMMKPFPDGVAGGSESTRTAERRGDIGEKIGEGGGESNSDTLDAENDWAKTRHVGRDEGTARKAGRERMRRRIDGRRHGSGGVFRYR